ncbi:MAG: hypothetical protein ACK6BM_10360 [Cyanobacteriota bacterium]|jgi:hypothetical protein
MFNPFLLRNQMTGPKGDSDPPKEIQLMRSFKEDKDKVPVHLKIQHSNYVYYMRLAAQQTPLGDLITNIGFGGQDMLDK